MSTDSCCRKPRPQCGGPSPPPSDPGDEDDDGYYRDPDPRLAMVVMGWFACIVLGLFGGWFVQLHFQDAREHELKLKAIDAGLEQRVMDGKVIWVFVNTGWHDPPPK